MNDATDCLPYKAKFFADQDTEDLIDGIRMTPSDVDRLLLLFVDLSRIIYQCSNCHRVFLQDHSLSLVSFLPEEPDKARDILSSVFGENWKRHLVGRWIESPLTRQGRSQGEIDYSHTEVEREFYSDWELFSARYYELLDQLRDQEKLREAHLFKNDRLIHSWKALGE